MIRLTNQPIDPAAVLAAVASPEAGAVVLFCGTTRAITDGRRTNSLDARDRWPLLGVAIVHRTGRVEIGETSVAVAVSTAHRAAAFEAGQWLIDTLKEIVPIWKKENWADGTSDWVHPGLTDANPS
ncbi:MAG: molybdenum cofactor biosynthesis protein MoaE [Planctomycetia bacterium]|nr:molybdenum cofactor biosynthesis protein MoaE [Planctomycetia bacterium]